MSLRDACKLGDAPAATIEIHFPHLSRAVRDIGISCADRPVRVPAPFHLDSIVYSVREQWRKKKTLADLPNREVRWLPHAIFHPEAERDAWLARDAAFMGAALGRMRERARGVRTLLRNVLRLWPKELSAAPQIERVLKEELRKGASSQLQQWHTRVERYGLLSADGPRKFAELLHRVPDRRKQVLEDAGLVGELERSEFLAETNRHLAEMLKRQLVSQLYDELEGYLEVLAPEGRLTFQGDAPVVADALLLPFIERIPPEGVRARIQGFLLTNLKDPRLTQSGWISVSQPAKDIMLRWMVSASLDEFFALIARRAQEDHWTYRQAFWWAYHKREYISRAWVVLGENAAREARARWGQAIPAHGKLSGGDPDHCVLLLHIGNVIIAEWSHNGICRVWRDDDEDGPSLYLSQYSRTQLTANAGYEQKHHGNLYYTWQQKLADVIHNVTGLGVTRTEYRVR